jgi:hypothetical protein
VEARGGKYVVEVVGGGAEFDKSRDGRPLLRIRITAEVDGVWSEYEITFGRYGRDNAALGFAAVSTDVPGGEGHLAGFARYAELADAIEKWLEETSR